MLRCGRARFARGDCSEAAAVVPLDISSFLRSGKNLFPRNEIIKNVHEIFREVCTIYLDGLYEDLGPIGGAGHVIEVDEMKMGRRKYNRGRVVDGSWILGFIDIETNDVRLEICPENKRDRDTLFALIEKHVAPDSCIFTDCWKGYTGLEERGFQHWTVNHQRQFVTEEGVNTNKIESQWRPLRQRLARGGIKSNKLAEHLCEYLYKKDTKRRNVDVFEDFIEIIKTQFPGR